MESNFANGLVIVQSDNFACGWHYPILPFQQAQSSQSIAPELARRNHLLSVTLLVRKQATETCPKSNFTRS
jgi:hypothetical protein